MGRRPDTYDQREIDFIRARDEAALAVVEEYASRAGVLERLREMPPATVDRVAAALGWDLGPTRATLQALAAGGLVDRNDELSTWTARRVEAAPRGARVELPDLAQALAGSGRIAAAALDDPPIAVLEEAVLGNTPELRAALERGARVVGLAGSDAALRWLAERYPSSRTVRFEEWRSPHSADLVLQLSPLDLPDSPEGWFRDVARGLAVDGHLVLRALLAPVTPPEPASTEGRGWWHAVVLAAALEGGAGDAWSEAVARRAAHAAGYSPVVAYRSPSDPGCVHAVARNGDPSAWSRPR